MPAWGVARSVDDGEAAVEAAVPDYPVFEGDFLGIFAGTILFAEDVDVARRIPAPTRNLFLDYSHVTGTLNQMQVSEPDSYTNVRLEWQSVNEKDETGPCESWRVLLDS
jgi:hypothetical protein